MRSVSVGRVRNLDWRAEELVGCHRLLIKGMDRLIKGMDRLINGMLRVERWARRASTPSGHVVVSLLGGHRWERLRGRHQRWRVISVARVIISGRLLSSGALDGSRDEEAVLILPRPAPKHLLEFASAERLRVDGDHAVGYPKHLGGGHGGRDAVDDIVGDVDTEETVGSAAHSALDELLGDRILCGARPGGAL